MTWKRVDVRAARQTPLKSVLEGLRYQLEPRKADNYLVLGLAEERGIKTISNNLTPTLTQNAPVLDLFTTLLTGTLAQAHDIIFDDST